MIFLQWPEGDFFRALVIMHKKQKTLPPVGEQQPTKHSRREFVKAALGTALAGIACNSETDAEREKASRAPRTSRPKARGPNVVLISLDTLRADRMHCYGNPRPTTPFIDRFVEEAVIFEKAFAYTSWTLPSHLSMFTGQYAGRFFRGMNRHYGYLVPGVFVPPRETPMLAETLHDAGYKTWGNHCGGFVSPAFGFGRGFDSYQKAQSRQSVADETARRIREHARQDQPFFLFFHTYIPHLPYEYGELFADHPDLRPSDLQGLNLREMLLNDKPFRPLDPEAEYFAWKPSPEGIEYVKSVYDGGVNMADRQTETVINALKDAGVYDDTIIIIMSDHGDEFWEHHPEFSPGHSHSLFDELLHVPLIIRMPGGTSAGTRVSSQARLIDVVPTIYDLLGIGEKANDMNGESMLPLLTPNSQSDGLDRVVYGGHTRLGPMRFCIRTSKYKYVFSPDPDAFHPPLDVPPEALYDLKADPGEQTNIVQSNEDIARVFRRTLEEHRLMDIPESLALDHPEFGKYTRQYLAALDLEHRIDPEAAGTQDSEALVEINSETIAELRALGYL